MTRTHVVSEDPDGTRCSDCKRKFEDGDTIHERVLKSMGTVDDLVHLPRATWDHDEPVWLIEPVCGECGAVEWEPVLVLTALLRMRHERNRNG